jgi:hypothetical protein
VSVTVSNGVTASVSTNLAGTNGSNFIVDSGGTVDVAAGGVTSGDVLSGGGALGGGFAAANRRYTIDIESAVGPGCALSTPVPSIDAGGRRR